MTRVALCEDDVALRSALRRTLERADMQVATTGTGAELLRAVEQQRPDVVVLDLGLPDSDGRDVCAALRVRDASLPVLMLTALDGTHHKVSGFQSGADDYLTKPFDVEELVVRLQALVRRAGPGAPTHQETAAEPVLDPSGHRLVLGDLEESLTPTEYRLVARLLRDPSEVVRRHALVAAGWPHGAYVSDNTLDSYVRRLRAKLDRLGGGGIRTVRGVGYQWR